MVTQNTQYIEITCKMIQKAFKENAQNIVIT